MLREDNKMNEMQEHNNEGKPFSQPISRRNLLKLLGLGGLGAAGVYSMAAPFAVEVEAEGEREIYVPKADGIIIAQPTRCVGCRRCELACTEFNEGKAQPSMARIKVGRNYQFGPAGAQLGFWRGEGRYGNHRIIQDTCKQCAHPVPCQLACPYGAIEVVEPVNARVVNPDKCQGCRTCQEACPWEMTAFDEEAGVATKCHLCAGNPECVQACPAGAIQYVPWQDMTKVIPERVTIPAYIAVPQDVQNSCADCH